jgi:hypothetical protein
MAPHLLFYQLLLVALVLICLITDVWWPDDSRATSRAWRCWGKSHNSPRMPPCLPLPLAPGDAHARRVTLPLVIGHAAGQDERVTAVMPLPKHTQRLEPLGVTLAESTQRRSPLQPHLRQQPLPPWLATHAPCPDGGTPLGGKAPGRRACRPWCGTVKRYRPRLAPGAGHPRQTASCRPRAALLRASVAPARLARAAPGSALGASGRRRTALPDCRPLARTRAVKTGRDATRQVARRLEAALAEDAARCRAGRPRAGAVWPPSAGRCTVGMDGGAGRPGCDKPPHVAGMGGTRPRSVGEAEATQAPSPKRLGGGQTLATTPPRRLSEGGHAPGCQRPQKRPLRADGDAKRRARQGEMRPQAPHRVAWHPGPRPLTVGGPDGQGLVQWEAGRGAARWDQSERRTGSRWQGQGATALSPRADVEPSMASCRASDARGPPWGKAWSAGRPSLVHHRHGLPHDGARDRNGEPSATGGGESTVHAGGRRRCCQPQQRQWSTEGAHVL